MRRMHCRRKNGQYFHEYLIVTPW